MVFRFDFGTPFITDSVEETVPAVCGKDAERRLSAWGKLSVTDGFRLEIPLERDAVIYGFGQAMGGINKRGRRYVSWCSDDPSHTEEKVSLYGAHNFFLLHHPDSPQDDAGFFFDFPGRISFDAGFTVSGLLSVQCEKADISCYVITPENAGNPLEEISVRFRRLIGRSYIPPRWAFGFMQSRWGYRTQEDIENVYEGYKKAGIPLDAVFLDIDYMKDFKDFTVDEEKFPDFPGLVKKMRADGVRLVPIIDAGVKIEDGYRVYEEGVRNGFFCKKADGTDYVAGVWPGRCHFPDFLNPQARRWFGLQYRTLTDAGAEGFWNDMNEPAMFYSDEGLQEAVDGVRNADLSALDIYGFFRLKDQVLGMANNGKDYRRFFHRCVQDGKEMQVNHGDVHNLYGFNMTRAAAEGLAEIDPSKRFLLFSRASCIGMHRYAGIWTGDNCSWWSHLRLELSMLPGLNLCGFLYTGADIGGFGCDTSRELLLRWLAFGIFTPLMRNHSAMGTREQECWRFEHPEDFARIISFRYRLLPYLYTEYMKSALNGTMYFRPLAFVWPEDKLCLETEDQLMVGENLMAAPVLEPNAKGRNVYLPEAMIQVRLTAAGNLEQTELSAGLHRVEIPPEELAFFIRKGRAVPLAAPVLRTDNLDFDRLEYIGDAGTIREAAAQGRAPYTVYRDDGYTAEYHAAE